MFKHRYKCKFCSCVGSTNTRKVKIDSKDAGHQLSQISEMKKVAFPDLRTECTVL